MNIKTGSETQSCHGNIPFVISSAGRGLLTPSTCSFKNYLIRWQNNINPFLHASCHPVAWRSPELNILDPVMRRGDKLGKFYPYFVIELCDFYNAGPTSSTMTMLPFLMLNNNNYGKLFITNPFFPVIQDLIFRKTGSPDPVLMFMSITKTSSEIFRLRFAPLKMTEKRKFKIATKCLKIQNHFHLTQFRQLT